MEIEQIKCPFCALSTPLKSFPQKSVLDPFDLCIIEIRECRGRKGLPVTEKRALVNHIKQYPQVYERLKDISLGLIWSMWKYELITSKDLPYEHIESKIKPLDSEIIEFEKSLEKDKDKEFLEFEESFKKPTIKKFKSIISTQPIQKKKQRNFIYLPQFTEEEILDEENTDEEFLNFEHSLEEDKDKQLNKEFMEFENAK